MDYSWISPNKNRPVIGAHVLGTPMWRACIRPLCVLRRRLGRLGEGRSVRGVRGVRGSGVGICRLRGLLRGFLKRRGREWYRKLTKDAIGMQHL